MIDVADEKIRTAFSGAAVRYDTRTAVHKAIGLELIKRMENHGPCKALLDIGMGTGWFTRRLTGVFPGAMVVGLDFACGMIACARRKEGAFKMVQADACRLPFKEGAFDIITSNLAYQWVKDLPGAFCLCRSRLNQHGILCFTMFGRHTFDELFTALETCAGGKSRERHGGGFAARRLAGRGHVAWALEAAGFKGARIRAERIKVRFPDMMGLIRWIKDIGANARPRDIYVGKDLLSRANDYYNTRFRDRGGVYATLEVIWVEARNGKNGE